MKTLDDIAQEISVWSYSNFGLNKSNKTQGVTLDEICPLMGMGEEIGELAEASVNEDREATMDAIGDILIYLVDYCNREGLAITKIFHYSHTLQLFRFAKGGLSGAYGKLLHANLKRHQGIRGYDDKEKYQEERNLALQAIVYILNNVCHERDMSAEELLSSVWNRIVSKRNWKKDQQNAGTSE